MFIGQAVVKLGLLGYEWGGHDTYEGAIEQGVTQLGYRTFNLATPGWYVLHHEDTKLCS